MDLSKDRSSRRFEITEPLPGRFDGMPVMVRDMGERGLQVEHSGPLSRGDSGYLTYTIPGRQKPIEVHAEVRWSQTLDDGANRFRSGLLVDSGVEVLNASIDLLLRKGLARLGLSNTEAQTPPEPAKHQQHVPPPHPRGMLDPSPQLVELIEEAREKLATSFDDSVKWYNRARFSLADPNVQRDVEGMRCKEDILAVWEFLGRSIDLQTIARVFEKR